MEGNVAAFGYTPAAQPHPVAVSKLDGLSRRDVLDVYHEDQVIRSFDLRVPMCVVGLPGDGSRERVEISWGRRGGSEGEQRGGKPGGVN